MTCTYEDIVSICDAHGIGLPVDCVEMVAAIVNLAAARVAAARVAAPTQGADDEPICNCKAEHWQPHAQYCPVTHWARDQFRKSGENAQGADARPVAIYQVRRMHGWVDVAESLYGEILANPNDTCEHRIIYATRDAAHKESDGNYK